MPARIDHIRGKAIPSSGDAEDEIQGAEHPQSSSGATEGFTIAEQQEAACRYMSFTVSGL
jgi:hypothetical protein